MQARQNRFDKTFKKAGGVVERRQGIADTVYHRLVTNKMWRVSDDIITDTVYHRLVTNKMWRVSADILTDTVYHRLVPNKMTHWGPCRLISVLFHLFRTDLVARLDRWHARDDSGSLRCSSRIDCLRLRCFRTAWQSKRYVLCTFSVLTYL